MVVPSRAIFEKASTRVCGRPSLSNSTEDSDLLTVSTAVPQSPVFLIISSNTAKIAWFLVASVVRGSNLAFLPSAMAASSSA
jgi:hypothetical protein